MATTTASREPMTWALRWALPGVASDIRRLPANLRRAGLSEIATGAVLNLSRGRWDKTLSGHLHPLLAGFVEVKFDLPMAVQRAAGGRVQDGPRFRVIAQLDDQARTAVVWAVAAKKQSFFNGQHYDAVDLAELRLIADDPSRTTHASRRWHDRRRDPARRRSHR